MDTKEEFHKEKVEEQAKEHFSKVIDGMIKWCLFEQEETLDVTFSAFGVDKKKVISECIKESCERWKLNE